VEAPKRNDEHMADIQRQIQELRARAVGLSREVRGCSVCVCMGGCLLWCRLSGRLVVVGGWAGWWLSGCVFICRARRPRRWWRCARSRRWRRSLRCVPRLSLCTAASTASHHSRVPLHATATHTHTRTHNHRHAYSPYEPQVRGTLGHATEIAQSAPEPRSFEATPPQQHEAPTPAPPSDPPQPQPAQPGGCVPCPCVSVGILASPCVLPQSERHALTLNTFLPPTPR
jgi:hypothetical protein